jgi:hypothetical protein
MTDGWLINAKMIGYKAIIENPNSVCYSDDEIIQQKMALKVSSKGKTKMPNLPTRNTNLTWWDT